MTTDAKAPRIDWLDAAKGMSILLVVFGHVFPPPLGTSVQLFRVPFFFFLSGFILKPGPTREVLWKRGNSLLVPYAVYLLLITALYVAVFVKKGQWWRITELEPNLVLLGQGLYGGNSLTGYYTPLWFLPVLFLAIMLFNTGLLLAGRAASWLMAALVAIGVGLSYALEGTQTVLAVAVVPVAMFFMWLGALYRGTAMPRWPLVPAVAIVAPALLFLDPVNLKSGLLGVPVLTLAAAGASCYVLATVCQLLARFTWFVAFFSPIGRVSIVILCLHQAVNYMMRDVNVPPLVIFPFAVALPFAAAIVFRRMGGLARWLLMGEPPPMPAWIRRPALAN